MDIAKLPPGAAIAILFSLLLFAGIIAAFSKKHIAAEYITRLSLILSLAMLFTEQSWWAAVIVLATGLLLVLRKGTEVSRVPYVVLAIIIGACVFYFKFFS